MEEREGWRYGGEAGGGEFGGGGRVEGVRGKVGRIEAIVEGEGVGRRMVGGEEGGVGSGGGRGKGGRRWRRMRGRGRRRWE